MLHLDVKEGEDLSTIWNAGDELVLGGSKLDGSGFEKVVIESIANGNEVTLVNRV